MLLLGVSIACLDRYQVYPGAAALLPTLGTAALLAAGPESWFNARVLSQPLLVGIGLISYPLYLWHWPLLVFQRIATFGAVPPWARLLAMACAFALAWATYRFVEIPVRRNHLATAGFLVAAMTLIGAAGLGSAIGWIQPWSASFGLEKILAWQGGAKFPNKFLRPLPSRGPQFYQDGEGARKVVYIGDSTMQQYSLRIHALVEAHRGSGRSAVLATTTGCPPFQGLAPRDRGPGAPHMLPMHFQLPWPRTLTP